MYIFEDIKLKKNLISDKTQPDVPFQNQKFNFQTGSSLQIADFEKNFQRFGTFLASSGLEIKYQLLNTYFRFDFFLNLIIFSFNCVQKYATKAQNRLFLVRELYFRFSNGTSGFQIGR